MISCRWSQPSASFLLITFVISSLMIDQSTAHHFVSSHGVGSHGVGSHGVGSHGVGSHGVGSCGVGSCGVGSCGVAGSRQEKQAESDSQLSLSRLYQQSNQQRAAGNYQEAIDLAAKVLEAMPNETNVLIHVGSCHYMLGEMKEAVVYFDRAIKADPEIEPQLWQRGLALYYLDRFADGQKQFETHQTYNTQDVENAVWHMLCQAKATDLETARKDLIPIQRDSRVPMKQIHQLFAGEATVDDVIAAAKSTDSESRQKESLYYAHLYIGLYQEMIGQSQQSLESMKQAVKINPIPQQYLMGQVAAVHIKLRTKDEEKAAVNQESKTTQQTQPSDK